MKTRIAIATCFILFALVFCSRAATQVIKVSEFPNTNHANGTDLFLLAVPGITNKNMSYNQLREQLGTNGASTQIITNLNVTQVFRGRTTLTGDSYITNLYLISVSSNFFLFNTNIYNNNTTVSNYFYTNVINNSVVSNAFFTNVFITNQYLTNLTVTNYIGGNTYLSNYFNTNVYNNSFVSNYYVTNLFTDIQQITTNQFTYNTFTNVTLMSVSNAYITNLFISQITTNSYLFSTNLFISYFYNTNNTYVSNYFQTNAFLNTYISNYFNTNLFNYVTNISQYTTNLTVTNFYLTDTFVSNFFNTNIFVNNSIVSNFFTTNLYNTINITSNYTFNVAWPLTNATLYGTTTFSPISGNQAGRIDILSAGVTNISLIGSNGAVNAAKIYLTQGILYATNAWGGPTNTLPLHLPRQRYVTFTPISVTGYTSLSNSAAQDVLLAVSNGASTNVLATFVGVTSGNWTNQYTISNASTAKIWFEYDPSGPDTNLVFRQMK